MLPGGRGAVRRRPGSVSVEPAGALRLPEVIVPGDFSSAAPFIVAATLLAGSELTIHGVGLNPRRTGLLDVLERMGARISIFNRSKAGGEMIGDIDVRPRSDRDGCGARRGAAPRRRAAALRPCRRQRPWVSHLTGAKSSA
jgi:5-enolpyruvylshikimate-3-phosphate synthase